MKDAQKDSLCGYHHELALGCTLIDTTQVETIRIACRHGFDCEAGVVEDANFPIMVHVLPLIGGTLGTILEPPQTVHMEHKHDVEDCSKSREGVYFAMAQDLDDLG